MLFRLTALKKKKNEAVGKGHMNYYVTNFPFRKQARILPGCLCMYICVCLFFYTYPCVCTYIGYSKHTCAHR